jgi:hypothetical protein
MLSRAKKEFLSKIDAALSRATRMHRSGELTDAELESVHRLAVQDALADPDAMSMEEYARMRNDGSLDELRDFAGTADGESPDDAQERDMRAFRRVAAAHVTENWALGNVEEQEAIGHLGRYVKTDGSKPAGVQLLDALTRAGDPKATLDGPEPASAWTRPVEEISEAEAQAWRADNPTARITAGTAIQTVHPNEVISVTDGPRSID